MERGGIVCKSASLRGVPHGIKPVTPPLELLPEKLSKKRRKPSQKPKVTKKDLMAEEKNLKEQVVKGVQAETTTSKATKKEIVHTTIAHIFEEPLKSESTTKDSSNKKPEPGLSSATKRALNKAKNKKKTFPQLEKFSQDMLDTAEPSNSNCTEAIPDLGKKLEPELTATSFPVSLSSKTLSLLDKIRPQPLDPPADQKFLETKRLFSGIESALGMLKETSRVPTISAINLYMGLPSTSRQLYPVFSIFEEGYSLEPSSEGIIVSKTKGDQRQRLERFCSAYSSWNGEICPLLNKQNDLVQQSAQKERYTSAKKTLNAWLDENSQQSMQSRLQKRVQLAMSNRKNEYPDENFPTSASNTTLLLQSQRANTAIESPPELSSKISIFQSELMNIIREKQELLSQSQAVLNSHGQKILFPLEEMLKLSTIIKLYYAGRKLSNMFLVQVVDRVVSSMGEKILAKCESRVKIEHLCDICGGWLKIVPNEGGEILRIDPKMHFPDVQNTIRAAYAEVPRA
jgi:hypothetical protein